MWIGIILGVICLLFQFLVRSDELVVLASVVGSCYWLFCVHRIHRSLAEYTVSSYSISPRKAVGFQFIPIYQYVWSFKWRRQIAKFVDGESRNGQTMPKVWPGLLLVSASVLGMFPDLKAVRLFLIFGFGLYLTRKLKAVLPSPRVLCAKPWQRWNVSMSAGIGAAFSFVLFHAVHNFFAEQPEEKLHEVAAIVLVSIGVVIFLEPAFDALREWLGHELLGIADKHPVQKSGRPLLLRLGVFVILVLTSFFHGLLHSEIDTAIKANFPATVGMLLAALVVSGGITYFWIGAARRRPSHAWLSGLLSGALLGSLFAFGLVFATARNPNAGDNQPTVAEKIVYSAYPFVPSRMLRELSSGNLRGSAELKQMGVITFPWPILGLAGGVAIDRRWGKARASHVALSLFGVASLCAILLWLTGRVTSVAEMASHLSAVIGWGLALIVCSSSKTLMPDERADLAIEGSAS